MDRLFSRFNNFRKGKILIVLDEAVDSCDRRLNNKMKNFITEDRVQIEQKGKDTIEVSDFANYVILTNNDFASIVEKSDRRYMCLVASPHRVGDRKYFAEMADKLLNVDAGCHLFHWLIRRDLSNFEVRDIPKTMYKKELVTRQTDNVVKWLLDMHEQLTDENVECETSLLTDEWYIEYTQWCRKSGESKVFSKAVFATIMNREGFTTVNKKIVVDGGRKTIRPRILSQAILQEKLNEYISISPPYPGL
jgi:phage/plasmid-associated DNA primase